MAGSEITGEHMTSMKDANVVLEDLKECTLDQKKRRIIDLRLSKIFEEKSGACAPKRRFLNHG